MLVYGAPTRLTFPRCDFAYRSSTSAKQGVAGITLVPLTAAWGGRNVHDVDEEQALVSPTKWQGWGTSSRVPAMVNQVIKDLRALESDADMRMRFGRLGGKI